MMMDRLRAIRSSLSPASALLVPSSDPHMSEYVADAYKRREYVSGFDGSAGTVLIDHHSAHLLTDARYWQQANTQLDTNVYTLIREGHPADPSLYQLLDNINCTAIQADPTTISTATAKTILGHGISIQSLYDNPIDRVWAEHRPKLPTHPLHILHTQFAGVTLTQKVETLRGKLEQQHALVISALDEIAWLFNLRGADVSYNPVFYAYALVTQAQALLFVDHQKIDSKVENYLKDNNVTVKDYNEIFSFLRNLSETDPNLHFWIDPNYTNYAIYQSLGASKKIEKQSPIQMLKAVKNPVEIQGVKNAHIRDAAAKIEFLYWLEENISDAEDAPKYTEADIADVLESLRKKQDHFVGLSFPTIAGSGPNGAIIHYNPSRETARRVTRKEMLLVDSGAQYLDGTTDVTRTVHLGSPSEFERECFTRVLQGHIRLAQCVFPRGTTGPQLDVLARSSLWSVGLNYGHGTGHGVGAYLNVHEGPHGISSSTRNVSASSTPLEAGMLVTNEPGFYREGEFGIRIENVMLVCEAYEGFLRFESVTLLPIDRKLIKAGILSADEEKWLSDYHAKVFEKVGPLLSENTRAWLSNKL